jgi:hypothetical protein
MTAKQTFTVELVGATSGTTHFIVEAKSPLGACRIVRNKWPHIVSSYDRRERHALAVLGTDFVSDRVGKEITRGPYHRPPSRRTVSRPAHPHQYEPRGRYRCESERGLSYEP